MHRLNINTVKDTVQCVHINFHFVNSNSYKSIRVPYHLHQHQLLRPNWLIKWANVIIQSVYAMNVVLFSTIIQNDLVSLIYPRSVIRTYPLSLYSSPSLSFSCSFSHSLSFGRYARQFRFSCAVFQSSTYHIFYMCSVMQNTLTDLCIFGRQLCTSWGMNGTEQNLYILKRHECTNRY